MVLIRAIGDELESYSTFMPLFEQLSCWFEMEYKGNMDVIMMHSVMNRVLYKDLMAATLRNRHR
jgi:hypothetical protein